MRVKVYGNALTLTSGRFETGCLLTQLSVARVYPHVTLLIHSFSSACSSPRPLISKYLPHDSSCPLSLLLLAPSFTFLFSLSLRNPPQPSMVPTWETSAQCGVFPHLPPQPKLEHAIGGSMEAASSTHLGPDVRLPP